MANKSVEISVSLTTGLWILGLSQCVPGPEPLGQILSYFSLLILSLSSKFLNRCSNFFLTFMM